VVALELAEELDELGHENRVVALALGLDGKEDLALPALVRSVELRAGMRASCSWRLRRLLDREPADVVLAHGGWAAQVAVFGFPRRGPAVVWQRILGFPDGIRKPARRILWRAIAGRVDGAAALTDEEADELRWLGFTGPVRVIANFRRPQRFLEIDRRVESVRLRELVGVGASMPLIGLVGHLVEQKRPERALDVLAGVHACGQPAHLVIVGDGPLRGALEQEVRSRGLEANVSMLGHRNDVERVFGGVDLVLLTSDVEGIPGVAIEATMTGCPVVSFPLGGVSQVVVDGVTGVVLDRPDTTLMARRVVDLLRDDTLRQRMSTEARQLAPEFSATEKAKVYAELLAQCIAHRAARASTPRWGRLRDGPKQEDDQRLPTDCRRHPDGEEPGGAE
jgi:glycosyltransferase involved in cell wall biosynthesis